MEQKAPIFERRWLMCDLARQRTFVREEMTLWLDALARLGYNGLGIYLEGAFAFRHAKGVVRQGAMTAEDAKWVVAEGKKRGIFVFPMTNVVGHMEHFFWQERYRALRMEGTENQLNFLDPAAKDFAMAILHDYADAFGTELVHVGGDETTLTEENKMAYAAFLADICKTLLDEGIQPAIWDDMLWMDLPMVALFDRRVMIFDWNYYGHRPESPRYFKSEGFDKVVVCPCDNGWEGVICYQRTSGYLKARRDIPVTPEEVEAFFDDARNEGVYNGMLTNWENAFGRDIWAAWTAIARGGLFMNGQLSSGEAADERVEAALFGRTTPYSALTHLFQDEIQRTDLDFDWFMKLRSALFELHHLAPLLRKSMSALPSFPEEYDAVLEKAEALLASWEPESPFEARCRLGMVGVTALVRAGNALIKAGRGYALYKEAAEKQFTEQKEAKRLLGEVIALFAAAEAEVAAFSTTFGEVIAGTGHTEADLDRLADTRFLLALAVKELSTVLSLIEEVPLPLFERVINRISTGKPIIR